MSNAATEYVLVSSPSPSTAYSSSSNLSLTETNNPSVGSSNLLYPSNSQRFTSLKPCKVPGEPVGRYHQSERPDEAAKKSTLAFTLDPKESARSSSERALKLVHLSVSPRAKTEDDLRQRLLVNNIPDEVVKFIGKPSIGFPWDIVVPVTAFDYLRAHSTPDFAFEFEPHPVCHTVEARNGGHSIVWEQGWRNFVKNAEKAFRRDRMLGSCYRELAISRHAHGMLAISLLYHELARYPRHSQEALFQAGLFLCSHMRDAKGNLCNTRKYFSRGPEESLPYLRDVWFQVEIPSAHPLSIIPFQDLMAQAAFLLRSLLCYLLAVPNNHPNGTSTTTKVFTPRVNLQVLAVAFGIVSFWPERLAIYDPTALHKALVASSLFILSTEVDPPVDGADFENWSRRLQGAMPIAYPDIKLGFSTEELDNIGYAVLRSIASFFAYTERSLGLQSQEHNLPMLLVWCSQQPHQVRDEVLVALLTHASSLRAELISELQHDMTLARAALTLGALLLLLTLSPDETQARLQDTSAGNPLMAFDSLLQGEAIDGEIATVKCAIHSFWEALSIKRPGSNKISDLLGLVLGTHDAEECHNDLFVMYWRVRGGGSHCYAMEKLSTFLAASTLELKSMNSQKPGHLNFCPAT